jgi:hypothetical protein
LIQTSERPRECRDDRARTEHVIVRSRNLTIELVEELRLTDPVRHRGDQVGPDEVEPAGKAFFESRSVDTFTVEPAAQPRGLGWRGSSSWWLLLVAVTVAAVVIGARAIVSDRSGHHEAAAATGAAYVKNIPAAYRVTAERVAPLAAGMSVDCAGALVPVPMLAAPGGDEAGPSPAAAALREVLAHNPWSSTSPIVGGNWLLLAETTDRAVFGQRVGAMGVGTVVVLSRSGSSYRPENLTGCATVVPGPNESGEVISSATAVGPSLELGGLPAPSVVPESSTAYWWIKLNRPFG